VLRWSIRTMAWLSWPFPGVLCIERNARCMKNHICEFPQLHRVTFSVGAACSRVDRHPHLGQALRQTAIVDGMATASLARAVAALLALLLALSGTPCQSNVSCAALPPPCPHVSCAQALPRSTCVARRWTRSWRQCCGPSASQDARGPRCSRRPSRGCAARARPARRKCAIRATR
jgi:hypothetical protein